jgi:hypothetical protein
MLVRGGAMKKKGSYAIYVGVAIATIFGAIHFVGRSNFRLEQNCFYGGYHRLL